MKKSDQIHHAMSRLFGPFADIASLFLVALMSITVIDVVGRGLGILHMRGAIELSNMTLVFLAFLALPQSFILGGHLFIEIATQSLPPRVNQFLDALWLVLTAIFLGFITWCTYKMALDLYMLEEVSLDLEMPLYIFWAPAIVGLALSTIAALWMAIRGFVGP